MSASPQDIAGLVLAGGRATRIGGGDKPLLAIAGIPMLDLVIERLAPQAGPVAISANGDPERFAAYGLPVLADDEPHAQAGPLAGILSGMRWARAAGHGALLTVAGDTPFFPKDLSARLVTALSGRTDHVGVATSGGRRHPVFALWPTSLDRELFEFLETSPSLSVAAFLGEHATIEVEFPMTVAGGSVVDPFFNVNTRQDLVEAEAILRRTGG